MKTIKKYIAYFLVFVFVVQSSGPCNLTCEAADGYFVSGNLCCHKIAKNKIEVYGLTKKCRILVIPEKVSYKGKKYTVTRIADMSDGVESANHVSDCSYLIPKNYLKRNKKAELFRMSGITKVVLPKTLTYIGEGAFCDASKLKKVVFAKKYKKLVVGRHAFGGNALKSLEFPEGTCELGDYAAGGVPNLTIPASVKRIGTGVVNSHTRNVKIRRKNKRFKMESGILYTYDGKTLLGASAGVKGRVMLSPETSSLAEDAFFASKVTEVDLGGNVREIPLRAFDSCTRLERVTGTEQVEQIGFAAFCFCKKLTDIGNLSNVRKIENYAFVGDGSLSIQISARMDVDDHAFADPYSYWKDYSTNGISSVSVEENDPVYSIENGLLLKKEETGKVLLLQTCNMVNVEVPEGVTRVPVPLGDRQICKSIILPESLKVHENEIRVNTGSIIYKAKEVPEFKRGFYIYNLSKEEKASVYVPANVMGEYRKRMNDAAGLQRDEEDWTGLFGGALELLPY